MLEKSETSIKQRIPGVANKSSRVDDMNINIEHHIIPCNMRSQQVELKDEGRFLSIWQCYLKQRTRLYKNGTRFRVWFIISVKSTLINKEKITDMIINQYSVID